MTNIAPRCSQPNQTVTFEQFSLKKRLTLQGSIRIMRPATPIRYREKKDGYVAQLVRAHHS
ncbi:hypothetical protein BB542_07170 [Escherichia coli]|uniref:Uncharacterized protein n=2 Tax=Enterobacteriaceae TaxID=543 RepID=A0A2D0DKE5_ECOLX|nr:hypothetical protein A8V32_29770 [Escherichia coli O157:H7]AST67012.1 hypothetical protein RM34_03540 [Escherichia coli]AUG19099.1 hypothetical protein CXP41_03700 [Escherichia coli str. K-12 substr. MG1655]AVJ53234.1 hypothetical protein CEP72_30640 [Escherichia coli O157]EFO2085614.1 hypothetical protein [Escherichia coli O109]EFO2123360.1 hypothetical protein [Escherichia coli O106]EFO2289459.1 hypothetical protein [Escherichia coli O148]EFO3052598.1 hypothetical protein [Escherichia c